MLRRLDDEPPAEGEEPADDSADARPEDEGAATETSPPARREPAPPPSRPTETPRPSGRAATMDLRTYGIGAQILKELGVGKMKLLANPRKMPSMAGFDLEVTGYIASPAA